VTVWADSGKPASLQQLAVHSNHDGFHRRARSHK